MDDLHNKELRKRANELYKNQLSAGDTVNSEDIKKIIEELRIHQIELELQNQDLKQTQEELMRINEEYIKLYDYAPISYITINSEKHIIKANLTFVQLIGYSKQEITGNELSKFTASESQDTLYLHLRKINKNHLRDSCEIELKDRSGNSVFVRLESSYDIQSKSEKYIQIAIIGIQKQKETEREYRKLFHSIQDGLFIYQDNAIAHCNATLCKMIDLPYNKMIGKGLQILVHSNNLKNIETLCMESLANKESHTLYELKLKTADPDSDLFVHLTVSPTTYRKKDALICTMKDITKQKKYLMELTHIKEGLDQLVTERTAELRKQNAIRRQAIKQLNSSQQRLNLALWATNLAWWDWNYRTGQVLFNSRKLEMLGYTCAKNEATAHVDEWIARIHPDDYDEAMDSMRRLVTGESPVYEVRYRLRSKNGTWIWFRDHGKVAHRDENGKPLRIIGTVQNISEMVESEEERNRIFNLSIDMFAVSDFNGRFKQVNPAWQRTLGWSAKELIKSLHIEYIHPDDREAYKQVLQQLNAGESIHGHETRFVCKNNEYKWLSWNSFPLQNDELIFSVIRDFTKRRQTQEELNKHRFHLEKLVDERTKELTASNRQLQRFRTALDTSADAIFLIDPRAMKFVDVNQPASHSLGYSREELLNMGPQDIKPDLSEQKLKQEFNNIISGKEQFGIIDTRHQRRDKTCFPVEIYLRYFAEQNLLVAIARDITDRKQNELELKKAKENAEHANRSKSEFLANMSHEIRTPMNAILGFTQILKEKLIEHPQYLEYLDSIEISGKNLLHLISDILDLSKIESGRFEIHPEPVNPHTFIREIKQMFSVKTNEQSLDFKLTCSDDLPKALLIDETRLRQVLFNLIGNALKFTHTGKVEIKIRHKYKTTTSIDMQFDIIDTGIGIPNEQQSVIFEPFRQQQGQDNRKYGGTGLGLAITKRLVEMMNGTISVKSKINEGSTFTVKLFDIKTTQITDKLKHADDNIPHQVKAFKKPVILLIEDVPSNRKVIKDYLETFNVKIIEAVNGVEGVDKAAQYKPDLILMDIQMPVMDGFEATRIIKSRITKPEESIPIVALTAATVTKQINKVREICDDYLLKPVSKQQLIKKLAQYLPYQAKPQEEPQMKTQTKKMAEKMAEFIEQNKPTLPQNSIAAIQSDFETARKTMSIKKIKTFANSVIQFGSTQKITILNEFGNQMLHYANAFKFNEILKSLTEFEKILQILQNNAN